MGDGGQRLVDEEAQALDGVRSSVDLAVVRDRLESDVGIVRLGLGAQDDWADGAVLHQVTDPVVRADDDVRAVAGLVGGHEVGLQVVGDDLDRYRDALLVTPALGDLLE